VPDRKDLGVLMLSVLYVVLECVGGMRGKIRGLGLGKTPKVGQLTLSMGPARAEVRSYLQRATIPSKMVAYILK
jgi:hypothetical protein